MTKTYSPRLFRYQDYEKVSSQEDVFLLWEMLRIRTIEEIIAQKYTDNQMKTPIHLMIGQEATVVGACSEMLKEDKVYCGHRTHGVYLAKGGSLEKMIFELHGKSTGCCGGRGGSMHLLDKEVGVDGVSAIVGGIVPIASGAALALKRLRINNIVTVFLGDGAMEEGAVLETLNLAALWKLPLLFICENNFYSVCTPLHERQPLDNIAAKAQAFGVRSSQVNGNNIYEIKKEVQKARKRALRGDGPSFIEMKVYRWLAHGGNLDDTDQGYRTFEEVHEWKKHCPIESLKGYFIDQGYISEDEYTQKKSFFHHQVLSVFDKVKDQPNPDLNTLYDHVYAK